MRKLWINNQAVDGSGGMKPVIDPATEEAFGEVAWGEKADAEHAVQTAKKAFGTWRKVPVPEYPVL